MFDSKQAMRVMEQMNDLVAQLQTVPQLIPIAREIFAPVLNGGAPKARPPVRATAPARPKRTMTAAQRQARSVAAKKRWRAAKKAGKNTIGGAD